MDLSRCVLITTEEHIWENILPYLFKKREKYNWILNRSKDSEKFPNDKVEVFVWWSGKAMFSSTLLRSHLKRLKQKDGLNLIGNKKRKECFKISKRIKTESILKKLIRSAGTHYFDDSFIGKELSKYLEAGVLRLKKVSESKVTKEPSMEVVEQQSEPQPSTSQQSEPQPSTSQQSEPQPSTSQQSEPQPSTSQQSEPQPSTSQQSEPQPSTSQQSEPQPSTSQVKVEDDEKQEDNNPLMKLSESQINGLILKLLSHVSVSLKSMTKDIAVLTSKMDKVTSKMDKVTETFRYKLYDPLFDDDFCMT